MPKATLNGIWSSLNFVARNIARNNPNRHEARIITESRFVICSVFLPFTGAPQFGHDTADDEILCPHSLQFISAILHP